jgi:hypothetical protein
MNKEGRSELDAFLANEDEIRKLALENAKTEHPPTESTGLDNVQTDLKLNAERIAAKIKADALGTINGLAGDLTKHEGNIFSSEFRVGIDAEFSNCKTKIDSIMLSARNNLAQLKERSLLTEKYLQIFKREHGIRRAPKDTPSKQVHYLWIFFYAIVEVIANIFFFNVGFSAFDALTIAVMLAAINLLISVEAGNFWRARNSPGPDRYFAYIAFLLWVVFVIWFNTATAITRSIMVAGDSATLSGAANLAFFHESWRIFVLSAPNISDLMSVLLWIAGAAVGALAFLEGYRSEDPIPGYTECADAATRAKAEYDIAEQTLRRNIESVIHEAQSRFDSYRESQKNSISQFNAIAGVLSTELQQAILDHEAVSIEFVRLINAYREVNRIRISDPPAYFAIIPVLDVEVITASEKCDVEGLKLRTEKLHEESNAKIIEIAAKKQAFTEKAADFPRVVDEEITAIDRQAKDALKASAEFGAT